MVLDGLFIANQLCWRLLSAPVRFMNCRRKVVFTGKLWGALKQNEIFALKYPSKFLTPKTI